MHPLRRLTHRTSHGGNGSRLYPQTIMVHAPGRRCCMAAEPRLAVRNFPPAGIQVPSREGQLRLPPPGKRTLITRQPVAQGATWGALRDIGYSVMEAPRHVDEVLGEYADLLRDNILLVITAALGFIAAEGASALFAVTPGFQPLAFLIQYALGLIGCVGSAVMIEDATRQGEEWVRLARTANGDRNKITLASKAFVRTFFDLLMAGLGGMAAARNFGKAGAIANAAPPGWPSARVGWWGTAGRHQCGYWVPRSICAWERDSHGNGDEPGQAAKREAQVAGESRPEGGFRGFLLRRRVGPARQGDSGDRQGES